MVVRIYFWDHITSYWLILTSTYQYLDSYDIKRDSRDFKLKKTPAEAFRITSREAKIFLEMIRAFFKDESYYFSGKIH